LPELVQQLGARRFGHVPRVGDPVCGGGSIPFEAARIGCAAYASDLSPVAALLTWGALHLVGGDAKTRSACAKSSRRPTMPRSRKSMRMA
jgi:putative DNA methylase